MTSNYLLQPELWMADPICSDGENGRVWQSGAGEGAGLRADCRAMSKMLRPRAPIYGHQTGTTFLRKEMSAAFRRSLVKARRSKFCRGRRRSFRPRSGGLPSGAG